MVKLNLSGLIVVESHPDMHKIPIIGFFFENKLHSKFEVEKISTNGCFRLHIYLHAHKTLIQISLRVLEKWGKFKR
jgi:hypothetical protein